VDIKILFYLYLLTMHSFTLFITFYRFKSIKSIDLYILFLSLENFFIFIRIGTMTVGTWSGGSGEVFEMERRK